MALSSTKIIKVIVVTDDLERTASAYRTLLGVDREPEPGNIPHNLHALPRPGDHRYAHEGRERLQRKLLV